MKNIKYWTVRFAMVGVALSLIFSTPLIEAKTATPTEKAATTAKSAKATKSATAKKKKPRRAAAAAEKESTAEDSTSSSEKATATDESAETTAEQSAATSAIAVNPELAKGTVPEFPSNVSGGSVSSESENAFYLDSIDRREGSLATDAPLKLRQYVQYLMDKYDTNKNGQLEKEEWKPIPSGQAVDLNGDFNLNPDELLFYLARYAKGRTIFRPVPPVPGEFRQTVTTNKGIVIHPLSAPVKKRSSAQAKKDETKKGLADLSEKDVKKMMANSRDDLEDVDDEELIKLLIKETDKTAVREYTVPPVQLSGMPKWFILRDLNGDGQLTLREFAPFLSLDGVAFFGRLDMNSDGFIVPDELRAYLQGRTSKTPAPNTKKQ